MIGLKFGRWQVVSKSEERQNYFLCECECGTRREVRGTHLKSGKTKSCGCYKKDKTSEVFAKHKLRNHPLYIAWANMKSRCNNRNNPSYKDYGERGIKICDEWQEFENFYHWSIANGYEKGLSLDRVNVNGNYDPSNVRFANDDIQANNKRNTRYITINGVVKTVSEWAKISGIKRDTFQSRIRLGWEGERLLEPANKRTKRT